MRKKAVILILMCVIAMASAAAVGGFMIYTLILRTAYRTDALEINHAFARKEMVTVSRAEETFLFPAEELEYYDKFLLDGNTVVFSRRSVPETEDTTLPPLLSI